MEATQLWSHWQALLQPCAGAFTTTGWQRFGEWLTGLVLNVEEPTITQSLVGLDRPDDGKALEAFAEYGSWDQDRLEELTAPLLDQAPDRLWFGYRVWAGDDTKVHRSRAHVWGTGTFHEYTARCPNRAGTVRAHNGGARYMVCTPNAAAFRAVAKFAIRASGCSTACPC